MSCLYLNFTKDSNGPWVITETNEDRTQLIATNYAKSFEINVPIKSFIGKYHYIYCEGVLSWDGTKAIIN